MPTVDTQESFLHELCEIHDAEHRFLEGQRETVQNATDRDLKDSIRRHIEQTEQHIHNLEWIFGDLGQNPQRETNEVAQGLASEAQEGIQQTQTEALRDCAIDTAVIKVEYFEMASYRGLGTGAQLIGQTEITNLLNENMRQEEETAQIAEQSAKELLQKAQREEGQGEEGLLRKAKEKLTGQ